MTLIAGLMVKPFQVEAVSECIPTNVQVEKLKSNIQGSAVKYLNLLIKLLNSVFKVKINFFSEQIKKNV
jgi:hypothetical protein